MPATEPEILAGRRAFAKAQELLAGATRVRIEGLVRTGWHDTAISPERPAFAVVRRDGPMLELIGEIIRVTLDDRSCFVYVLGSALVPVDLSLTRRAFMAIGLLAAESVDTTVEVVG